jgi:hypothetical protein
MPNNRPRQDDAIMTTSWNASRNLSPFRRRNQRRRRSLLYIYELSHFHTGFFGWAVQGERLDTFYYPKTNRALEMATEFDQSERALTFWLHDRRIDG